MVKREITKNSGVHETARRFRGKGARRDQSARPGSKKATNVSIDAEILAEAKRLDINLSRTLEDALRERVEGARIEKWQKENKAFFDSYNALIERTGTMSEALLDLDDPSV